MKWTEADLRDLELLGISKSQVHRQLDHLATGGCHVGLNRPCNRGDGLSEILPEKLGKYLQFHEKAVRSGRFLKFVPASGAATRMFQNCFQVFESHGGSIPILRKAARREKKIGEFFTFWDNLENFAFYDDLRIKMARDRFSLEAFRKGNRTDIVLAYLLMDWGLNYASLPKALLKFHRYNRECRTALEEHIVEGTRYLKDARGVCRFHFTSSPEHKVTFHEFAKKVLHRLGKRKSTNYAVDFSVQARSTDCIAVGPNNTIVRDERGRLLFRPGGHGALLDNLNNLNGDLVYIKNIDNIAYDHLMPLVSFWNRLLGGFLVEVEEQVHNFLKRLSSERFLAISKELEAFAREILHLHFPESYSDWSQEQRKTFLFNKLNRPIRVCGMVPNKGEPGGGPFWAQQKDGALSLQIVEASQVDLTDSEQSRIWGASTYFNPVNLVCALRDYQGRQFDLNNYVDHDAVVICQKSTSGKRLKALELPGLWNGAMAEWNTIFVEIPGETFCPVKTVNDLLRPEHQPKLSEEFLQTANFVRA